MPAFQKNIAQYGDALDLLRSLPDPCTRLTVFDPQHRENLDKLAYGNEGSRQRERSLLPQMPTDFIFEVCRESARVLLPGGYLAQWMNTFQVGTGYHLRVADTAALQVVDLSAWDNQRMGMGARFRRRGDYLVLFQKPPIKAKATWSDHGIADRWPEKVDRKLHPHVKPIGLISHLIGATTTPGELVIDPAAGSFTVMHAALALGREFLGCDIAYGAAATADVV